MNKKHNLKIIGSFFGTDGYTSHTKNLFNALAKRDDTNMKIETQLIQNWQRQVNDLELDAITKEDNDNFDNIIIAMPHQWKLLTGINKNYAFVIWEGDKVPEAYIEEFLNPNIDLIFVPSEHTKKAILKTVSRQYIPNVQDKAERDILIQKKIVIIPHGVDKSIFYPKEKKHEKFTFVCNKGWRGTNWDRGGVQYVLKAFGEEFKKEENVRLVLKLNPAYINGETLNQAIKNMNLPETRAQIDICLDNIPFNKLIDFYADGDIYVCATRAEAFNLPGMEAMACGLPTVQTDFGGQLDYMTYENSLIVDYELQESEEKPMYESINWAVPDINDLKKQLRWCFDNQDKIKKMGKQALEDSKKWLWEISAKKVVKSIENSQK